MCYAGDGHDCDDWLDGEIEARPAVSPETRLVIPQNCENPRNGFFSCSASMISMKVRVCPLHDLADILEASKPAQATPGHATFSGYLTARLAIRKVV